MFFKKEAANGPAQLKEATLPIEQALILICEKCGKKKSSDSQSTDNESTELQKALKNRLSTELGKGQVKAILTGCMSLCPEKEITIGIVPLKDSAASPLFFSLKGGSTVEQTETVLIRTLQHLKQPSAPPTQF